MNVLRSLVASIDWQHPDRAEPLLEAKAHPACQISERNRRWDVADLHQQRECEHRPRRDLEPCVGISARIGNEPRQAAFPPGLRHRMAGAL